MIPKQNEPLAPTALIVDDVPANRDLLRQTLESRGYEILLAPDIQMNPLSQKKPGC